MTLRDRLLHACKIRDLEIPKLARKAGVTYNSFKNYMRQDGPQFPPINVALAIAKSLNVSPEWLFDEAVYRKHCDLDPDTAPPYIPPPPPGISIDNNALFDWGLYAEIVVLAQITERRSRFLRWCHISKVYAEGAPALKDDLVQYLDLLDKHSKAIAYKRWDEIIKYDAALMEMDATSKAIQQFLNWQQQTYGDKVFLRATKLPKSDP